MTGGMILRISIIPVVIASMMACSARNPSVDYRLIYGLLKFLVQGKAGFEAETEYL